MLTLLGRFEKQPIEIKDYVFSAVAFLASKTDTIASYTVEVEPGLTIVSHGIENGNLIRVFVSGGVDGMEYKVTCVITTVGGRREAGEILVIVIEV